MQQFIENFIIGIDVSKEKLDLFLVSNNIHTEIKNNRRDIGNFFTHLKRKEGKIMVLLEPTGGYESLLIQKLLDYDIEVRMVHPNRLYHFAKSKGFDAKTDKLSSQVLALYLQEQPLHAMTKIGQEYKETKRLKELSSRRGQLKEMLHGETCREGHDFLNKEVVKSHKRIIKMLKKEIEKLNDLIQAEISNNDELTEKKEILTSFKGVGEVTSESLLLDVPELGKLSREEIAKMVGVAPLNNDSGKKQGGGHIRGGRGHVRKVLYMSALVAVRFNPRMKALYERLLERGKCCKVALVAVMRKMLCLLNSMVKKRITWQKLSGLAVQ